MPIISTVEASRILGTFGDCMKRRIRFMIETEGGTLEEERLEFRELLCEMAIHEEDHHRAELGHYNDLATIAWWEHDETEDTERELRILQDGTRPLILHLFHAQSAVPPKHLRRIKRLARRNGDEWLVQPHPL